MANRIITFLQDPILKRLQDNPYEVFLDVAMYSKPEDHSISVTHDIPPVLDLNYITLIGEDTEGQLELILNENNITDDNYTKILTYVYASDYDTTVFDEESIFKYYSYLVTDPNDSSTSTYILTDPNDSGLFIALLSSDEYTLNGKTIVEWKENFTYAVNRLVNVNAIRNSLKNIFSWIPGERVLLPEFGSNLRKLLYEGITDYNVELIIAEIKQIVLKWEPRVSITNIVDVSTVDDHENNTVHIKIIYIIPGLSDAQFEYDYILPISEY